MTATASEAWGFPPDPASTRDARRRVSGVLESCSLMAAATTAALVVSELTTNAVLHARTPFQVRLTVDDVAIRIEVHDDSERPPVRRYFSDESASGRGLRLVEELSTAWGVVADHDGPGKTVWAELALSGASAPAVPFEFQQAESL